MRLVNSLSSAVAFFGHSRHPHGVRPPLDTRLVVLSKSGTRATHMGCDRGDRGRPCGQWSGTRATHMGCDAAEIYSSYNNGVGHSRHPHGVRQLSGWLLLLKYQSGTRATHMGCDYWRYCLRGGLRNRALAPPTWGATCRTTAAEHGSLKDRALAPPTWGATGLNAPERM